jgi:hypothetical protein
MRRALVVVLALAALGVPPLAHAAFAEEDALAQRYAPVVRLVYQAEECGPGEPYQPMDVDVLFAEPTVALRGPWGGGDLIKVGPTADDLAKGLYEYHLDFPGNALEPGCDYEKWARRLTKGKEPTVYAHVATDPAHPGKLALQYWIFYAYNDWNNLHEGDWEMVQLVFDADDARAALATNPTEIGYSQHEGAERADWNSEKLEREDDIHPVVHPAAGSHANFFDEGLHLGSSAEQGVGCDDTTGPTYDLHPVALTIPNDPADAKARYPWIDFQGRWGELQRAFFNGPTGPNLKTQWTEPITWSESWRDRAYAVPAGGALGTGATDFFCGAVAGGSKVVRQLANEPLPVFIVLGLLVALLLYLISRATWSPTAPLRLARRRAWGQIQSASARMYVRRMRLFVGIGLVLLPISVVVTLLQWVVVHAASILGIPNHGQTGGLFVWFVVVIGSTLTLLGLALVMAATTRALVEIDAGRPVGIVDAYRLAFDSVRPLLGAVAIAVVVVSVLATSIFLLPIAIWLAVRWALFVPVVELENQRPFASLRRSAELVRQEWLKVGSLIVVGGAIVILAGPFIGALLILLTSFPLSLLNIVAGVVYAVAMPYVALATVYVYFDTRVREQVAPREQPDELPAEIELA